MPLHYLFDWGDTLMLVDPRAQGPMCRWPHVQAVAGAEATLKALSAVAGCHIATNAKDSTAEEIRGALDRVHLGRFISKIFCYRTIGAEKPSKIFFSRILQILDCRPQDLLMVGDHLQKDVLGAQEFGIPSILFNPHGTETPPGIRSIHHLTELLRNPTLGTLLSHKAGQRQVRDGDGSPGAT